MWGDIIAALVDSRFVQVYYYTLIITCNFKMNNFIDCCNNFTVFPAMGFEKPARICLTCHGKMQNFPEQFEWVVLGYSIINVFSFEEATLIMLHPDILDFSILLFI